MVAIVGREPYAGLVDGTRGKGGAGGRHLELKMWLKKGAYWQWEEQERMEVLVDGRRLETGDDDEEVRMPIGMDQVKRLLGQEAPTEDPTRLQAELQPQVEGSEELDREPYDDGTPALYYLGMPTARVPQRIITLLRKICSAAPASRPAIDSIVAVLEEELHNAAS